MSFIKRTGDTICYNYIYAVRCFGDIYKHIYNMFHCIL